MVILENSCETVAEQLLQVGVPADCYDGIATSGDVTRSLIAGYAGRWVDIARYRSY